MRTYREHPLILLLGKDGQVGSELRHTLAPLASLVVWGRKEANLAHPDQIRNLVDDLRPDVIVNAAAYTAVDRAEKERVLARTINGESPGVLAESARKNDALLVHYSTDYVFDGSKDDAYLESDDPCPMNIYGETKLAGEKSIIATDCKHLIFRTSWVYSWTGSNFLKTMLRVGRERDQISVVNDQFGAPTWARMIAEATALVLSQTITHPESFDRGIYNLTAMGRTSWYEFAEEIFRLAKRNEQLSQQLKVEVVQPINSEEFPTPAKRPSNSELSHEKLWDVFRVRLPDWKDSLAAVMDRYPSA